MRRHRHPRRFFHRLPALFAAAVLPLQPAFAQDEINADTISKLADIVRWSGVITSLIVIVGAWALLRLLSRFVSAFSSEFSSRRLMLQKVNTLGQFVIYVTTTFIVMLLSFRFDETTLALIGGTIAVAIGFAMKDLVASFIAGVIVMLDRYQLSVLDRPTDGEILIDDVDVLGLSEKEQTTFRLHTLGYVFQDYALVPDLDARENVMMPLLMRGIPWNEARAKADTSLDSVELKDKYTNLPAELSGGEQQRVAIARAIAGDPKIIFADEPTANLDTVSGTHVIELLTKLHNEQGLTIVMVTHEYEYAQNCNRIIYIEDGTVVSKQTQ